MGEDLKSHAPPVVRRFSWRFGLLAIVVVLAAGLLLHGPSGILRWAVRVFDPAMRLELGPVSYGNGSWRLRDVQLRLRGRPAPIFQAKEITLGLGDAWRHGRLGLLVMTEPLLSLDKLALQHFTEGSGDGSSSGWPWEFARVEIRGGHLWQENVGQQGMDVSCGVEGVLERLGPGAPGQEQVLDLNHLYLAVRPDGIPVPLFGAGQANLRVTLDGLVRGELEGLRVDRGWLMAGEGLQQLASSKEGEASSDKSVFFVRSLDLVNLEVSTGETSPGLPELSFKVNTAMSDVGLGLAAEEIAEKIHQVEFSDIEIMSPYDPLKRVVTVRSVFAKFSLAGLSNREIEELTLLSPTIFVGESLFEYMQQAEDQGGSPPEPVEAAEGWMVKRLDADFGRVIIAVGGRSQVGLPLSFRTSADNLSLTSLAGLNLNLVLTIPPDNYDFPAYDVSFNNVRGDLLLNYPPQGEGNNLVNVVKFDRGRWRNFTARNMWVSVTFDLEGINGQFGGEAYRGYVTGGFSFFMNPEAPWTGWVSGTKLDLGDLTTAAAPQHFLMSGRAGLALQVNGSGPEIERVLGSITSSGGGRMVVTKLDDMLSVIPPEWSSLKQEVTRVGLETLRDFDYTKASGSFWFVGKQGRINLQILGPAGARNFDVVLHGKGAADRVWSQIKQSP